MTVIEPADVAHLVDLYVDSELRDEAKYDNRTPLDGSGVFSLHRIAAEIYALGYRDGVADVSGSERRTGAPPPPPPRRPTKGRLMGEADGLVEALARARFDRGQAHRMDAGGKQADGTRWRWEHLTPDGQRAYLQLAQPDAEVARAWFAATADPPQAGQGERGEMGP